MIESIIKLNIQAEPSGVVLRLRAENATGVGEVIEDQELVALGRTLSVDLPEAIDRLFKRNSIDQVVSKIEVYLHNSLGTDSTASKIIEAFAKGLAMAP